MFLFLFFPQGGGDGWVCANAVGQQASVRQRGSISSPRPAGVVSLVRADTAGTAETGGSGRLRSDSNLSSTGAAAAAAAAAVTAVDGERETVLPHPVEPRATTATLPPVLVCLLSMCRCCEGGLR
jgi:hypothetical protein